MQVRVAYNDRGQISAATIAGENADEIVPAEGERVGTFDVPGAPREVATQELIGIFKSLSVDVSSGTLEVDSEKRSS